MIAQQTSRPCPHDLPAGWRAFGAWSGVVLALGIFLLVVWPAMAGEEDLPAEPAGIPYRTEFTGVADNELLKLVQAVSQASQLEDKPPSSFFLMRGRARGDLKKIEDALASRGYFAGKAAFAIDENASPARVTFTIDPGPAFVLRTVDIRLSDANPPVDFPLPAPGDIGLALDAPAVSKSIVDAEAKLVGFFKNKGRPFAAMAGREAVADFEAHALSVTYVVSPGPEAVFGPTVFTGLKNVKESLPASLVPWKEGEPYRQDQVALLERRLSDLGLFARVSVAPRGKLDDAGRAVIVVALAERKQRTFKGGVYYNTDDGPGAKLSWEHRNLFGRGEQLKVSAEASRVTKILDVRFENPFFLDQKQRLLAGFRAAEEDTEAFHGRNVTAEVKISRQLAEKVTAEAGVGWRSSLIFDDAANPMESGGTRYDLFSIPLGLKADTRDDPLNAAKGFLFSAGLSPHYWLRGDTPGFLKTSLSGAHYLKILDKPSLILATRASLGAITGVSASKLLPPDVRYYAGGSGSVRGYAYQTAGPLRGDKPLGGLSLFDFSAELRIRLTEMFGLVLFVDGGNAYETAFPQPGKGILVGAGAGLRVFTPIGPLRADVATPLYKRGDVDRVVQFYISLGQAF